MNKRTIFFTLIVFFGFVALVMQSNKDDLEYALTDDFNKAAVIEAVVEEETIPEPEVATTSPVDVEPQSEVVAISEPVSPVVAAPAPKPAPVVVDPVIVERLDAALEEYDSLTTAEKSTFSPELNTLVYELKRLSEALKTYDAQQILALDDSLRRLIEALESFVVVLEKYVAYVISLR